MLETLNSLLEDPEVITTLNIQRHMYAEHGIDTVSSAHTMETESLTRKLNSRAGRLLRVVAAFQGTYEYDMRKPISEKQRIFTQSLFMDRMTQSTKHNNLESGSWMTVIHALAIHDDQNQSY